MKNMIMAILVLTSSAIAQASNVTILSTQVPATRGYTTVETKFFIDTEMKEGYAQFLVQEQFTTYVRVCNGGPGYPYPNPRNPRNPRQPYPGNYCRTVPQTQYRTILSDRVKIEGMTMNGDDVIYQDVNGDVVCGTMGRSRVLRVPTLYLSGKCNLNANIYRNFLTINLNTQI